MVRRINTNWHEFVIVAVLIVGFILGIGMLMWFQAVQEANAFNRCNPGSDVTPWEAAWAEYRIIDCTTQE